MPYFQNPFPEDYNGNLSLQDRQYTQSFQVRGGPNRSNYLTSTAFEPYNFTANTTFTINFSLFSNNFKSYSSIPVTITATNIAAAKAYEVVAALNNNTQFAGWYVASTYAGPGNNVGVLIKSTRPNTDIRTYINNDGAEQILKFNYQNGVNQLPTYFRRDTVANTNNYSNSVGMLIELNPVNAWDSNLIINAGQDPAVVQPDWQLMQGKASGLFDFQSYTYDGNTPPRITQILEFPAGSIAGAFARKILYSYTGTNTSPDTIYEIPYTLTQSDVNTYHP